MSDSNQISESQLAWNMMIELREEILENSKARTQLITAKFTFLGALFGILLFFLNSNRDNLESNNLSHALQFAGLDLVTLSLFLILTITVSFDVISSGYELSTNRIANYIKNKLEPEIIKQFKDNDKGFILWEEYLSGRESIDNQVVFAIGIRMFTFLIIILVYSYIDFSLYSAKIQLYILLFFLVIVDFIAFLMVISSRIHHNTNQSNETETS